MVSNENSQGKKSLWKAHHVCNCFHIFYFCTKGLCYIHSTYYTLPFSLRVENSKIALFFFSDYISALIIGKKMPKSMGKKVKISWEPTTLGDLPLRVWSPPFPTLLQGATKSLWASAWSYQQVLSIFKKISTNFNSVLCSSMLTADDSTANSYF